MKKLIGGIVGLVAVAVYFILRRGKYMTDKDLVVNSAKNLYISVVTYFAKLFTPVKTEV